MAPLSDEIRAILRRPFDEQVAFFLGKLGRLVPTATWRDLMREAHDCAFMVAGAAKADLLADLAEAVDKAIAEGESLQKFRQRFAEIVERHGWHGWTGEETKAGRAWRTLVIYMTNMRTSYAAGRLAQLKDFPIWVYRHSGAEHPRLQHLAWDGLTLPADHPFWAAHYPPNGWGCGCRVAGASSREGARRLGGKPDYDAPPPGWDVPDPKTGLPPGIQEGWDYMPGASVVDRVRALAPKLDRLPPKPSIDLIQEWLRAEAFARWYADPKGAWPLARLPDADAEALGAREGVRVARMSEETARKQRAVHPEITPQEYAQAQRVIDEATVKVRDGSSFIYVLEKGSGETGGQVLVVKATQTGKALWVTSFRRLRSSDARRDSEIRRLLKKEHR